MALAQKTEILLLDEPTTYLDMAHQLEVLQIVEKLNKEQKITTVMVLHDINHASRFSHEIITMKEGEIVKIGNPGEIITPAVLEEVCIHARVMIDPTMGHPFVLVMTIYHSKKYIKKPFYPIERCGS